MSLVKITDQTVVVHAKVILECSRCSHTALSRMHRFDNLDIHDLQTVNVNTNHIDINVGWSQSGRGNYLCPACTGGKE